MADKKRPEVLEELRAMTVPELEAGLSNERRKLYVLRTRALTKQITNMAAFPQTRKQIARIMTIIHERYRAEGL